MRKVSLIFLISSLLFGCVNTKLTVSWTQENIQAKKYNNLGVMVMFPSDPNRLLVEESITSEFNKSGINSTITFYSFPLAGKKDMVKNLNYEPGELKKMMTEKIKANKIDALLIVSFLDAKQEERYVKKGIAFTAYYDPTYPVYNQTYYDYYSYVYNTTYSTGYYTTETTYFVETNLYDIESEKLLWTAQTQTENMSCLVEEAKQFAKIIVKDIIEKDVLIVK